MLHDASFWFINFVGFDGMSRAIYVTRKEYSDRNNTEN
jgi:hypothetical protein